MEGSYILRSRKIATCILALFFMTTACGSASPETAGSSEVKVITESGHSKANETGTTEVKTDSKDASDPDISVWYPYWDNATADEELKKIGDDLTTICFFAAYYDVSSRPFIPEDTVASFERLKKNGTLSGRNTYLTFVNDKLLEKGSSLKDTQLLYALIGSEELSLQHAKEVVDMAKGLGCSGVEIDYEAIKKDDKLWNLFNRFVTVLSKEAQQQEMDLRIVFEPSAPIQNYTWPSYPEYVMMCYNLHGYGTDPGAKAEPLWIKELSTKMKTLPGKVNLAFATGGFDFAGDGSVKQINLKDALSIKDQKGAVAIEDSTSGDKYFDYNDDSGQTHQVWYADQETLKLWIQTARDSGINRISVWRLGGNL